MCSPIPQGDWKLSFKPDKKPPKPLFDQFWEVLGKFLKAVFPIILLVAALVVGYLLGGGELRVLFDQSRNPIEDIFQDPGNANGAQQSGRINIPPKNKKTNKSKTILVAVVDTPDAAQDIVDALKDLRLNPSLQTQGVRFRILIKHLVSHWRARHVLNDLQESGFPQARIVSNG